MRPALTEILSSLVVLPGGVRPRRSSLRIRFGEHKSKFLGKGSDFYQIREYNPERDSMRQILWRHRTADPSKRYVRESIESKEMVVLLLLDLSSSLSFGIDYSKKERLLLEAVGEIGLSAAHAGDRVGLIGFTDRIVIDKPPRMSETLVYYLIREVYDFLSTASVIGRKTDMYCVLDFVERRFRDSCLIFIFSDFIDWEHIVSSPLLRQVNSRHEVVFVIIDDPEEFDVNIRFGSVRMKDMEKDEIFTVPIRSLPKMREGLAKRRDEMRRELRLLGIDSVELVYGEHRSELAGFFEKRRQR